MPQNLELKAALDSSSRAVVIARRIGARDRGTLLQVDTYYRVPSGRLKLRVIDRSSAELIAYARPERAGGRYSQYLILPVSDAPLTDRLLRNLLGMRIVVRKRRRLFLYRNARIHLDSVTGLGVFIEFEVLVTKGRTQARRLFRELVRVFGLTKTQGIAASYCDLLERKLAAK